MKALVSPRTVSKCMPNRTPDCTRRYQGWLTCLKWLRLTPVPRKAFAGKKAIEERNQRCHQEKRPDERVRTEQQILPTDCCRGDDQRIRNPRRAPIRNRHRVGNHEECKQQ